MPIAGGANVLRLVTRQCGREKLTKRVERVAPGIALVLDETMQRRDADGLACFPPVFQCSRERRDARKLSFRQKITELNFRMDARLHAAIDLQHKPIAKSDAGVTLFHIRHGRCELGVPFTPYLPEYARVGAGQFSKSGLEASSSSDGAQQCVAEGRVPDCAI